MRNEKPKPFFCESLTKFKEKKIGRNTNNLKLIGLNFRLNQGGGVEIHTKKETNIILVNFKERCYLLSDNDVTVVPSDEMLDVLGFPGN